MANTIKLYRSELDQVLGGVAGGLGEYFDVDSALMRVLFIFLSLAGGSGVLIYLLLWLIVPKKSNIDHEALSKEALEANAKEMEEKAKQAWNKVKRDKAPQPQATPSEQKQRKERKKWFGFTLLILGLMIFLRNIGIFDLAVMWPFLLVVVGLMIVLRN